MSRICLYKGFNNYYNKIVKRFNSTADYPGLTGHLVKFMTGINFAEKDGVDTTLTIRVNDNQIPDYLLVADEEQHTNDIVSRWFVIDANKVCEGQYFVTLKRDLIADYYNEFINANGFIEKGYIDTNANNPLLFNRESFQANQIKTKEYILKNKTDTPFIVLYLARTTGNGVGAEYIGKFQGKSKWYTSQIYNYNFGYKLADGGYEINTDAEYEIIAIPYTDNKIKFSNLSQTITILKPDKNLSLQWAAAIVEQYKGAGYVYDAQLVPYSSLNGSIDTDGVVDFTNSGANPVALTYREDNRDKYASVGFKLREHKFTQNITIDINHLDFQNFFNKKASNQLDLFRLCSPNGVGNYDYSMARNQWNSFNSFNIDCTLKPINPYIKISPIFTDTGLYGADFNDYRGLICNGDFSLATLTNQWQTYQLENKNYQTIFNRQIETQDRLNEIAYTKDIINATTGSLGGAVGGAVVGGTVGGPIGAAIGGIAGGLASSGGGAADVLYNKEERELQKQLTEDVFSLNLGNVQARPVSLTRSSMFDYNNKLYPYLEYYTCSPVEKEAFLKYLKYRGYKVGIYDTIKNYMNAEELGFIQGTIAEIDIKDDYHLVDEINKYFKMGFRIKLES